MPQICPHFGLDTSASFWSLLDETQGPKLRQTRIFKDYLISIWTSLAVTGRHLGKGIGGAEGNRTLDLCIANAALSQLSYRPTQGARF